MKEENYMKKSTVIIVIVLFGLSSLIYYKQKTSYPKTVDKFFSAFEDADGEKFFNLTLSEAHVKRSCEDYYDDYSKTDSFLINVINKLSKEDYIESQMNKGYEMMSVALNNIKNNSLNYYGNNMKSSYKIIDEEEMTDIEIKELWNYYKTSYPCLCYSFKLDDIDEGKKLTIDYKCKGKKNSRHATLQMNLYYIAGYGWFVDERFILNELPTIYGGLM